MTNSINGTPLTNRGVGNTLNCDLALENQGIATRYPLGLENFILIDWFQATILGLQYDWCESTGQLLGTYSSRGLAVDLFENLFGINPTQLVYEDKGVNGYNANLHYEDIYIMWNTRRDEMGLHIKMSGQGCRDFENLNLDYIDFFKNLSNYDVNYNRIDISIDQFTDKYFTLSKLLDYVRKGLVSSKFRTVLNIEKLSLSKAKEIVGHTLQFGSKASNVQITFYDKLKERSSKNIVVDDSIKFWTRTEVRYRHSCCQQVVELLLNNNDYNSLNDIVKSTLKDYISFKTSNSDDSNISRRSEVAWWTSFLANIDYLQITNYLPESSITRKANWLATSCSRSNFLVYLSKLDNLKTDLLTDQYLIKFLQLGSSKFDFKDLQLINDYRISNKLEPFTVSEIRSYIDDLNLLIAEKH